MKNPLEKFYEFIFGMQEKTGEKPSFIPLSRVEKMDVLSNCDMRYAIPLSPDVNTLMGINTFDTPFAGPMRVRQLEMPLTKVYEHSVVEALFHNAELTERTLVDGMFRQLQARVVSDVSAVNVTFEWDPFAHIKRFLRLTKWLPVKQRTVTIDCRVLYPYIKVQLPHNKHHAQFNAR